MRTLPVLAIAISAFMAVAHPSHDAEAATAEEAALAEAVKAAIASRDLAALEQLVYWDGANEGGRKFFNALLETAMEIKVDDVTVGPVPAEMSGPPTTLPVILLLRISGSNEEMTSRQSFPVGEMKGKLYLVCPIDMPEGME